MTNANIIENHVNIRMNFLARTGAMLLLLLCAASCTQRPETARDTAASDSASPPSRGAKAGQGDVGGVRKTTDPGALWSGESGGHAVRWLKNDLLIGSGHDPKEGMYSLADSIRREWAGDDSADAKPCAHESSFRLLSAVGSIISVERSDYVNCPGTAHPSVVAWYSVIDAADPHHALALDELFPERDIFAALMADGVVKKTLAKAGATPPGSLRELIRTLAGTEGECEYAFGEDMLTHFAFHHIEGKMVAVRLGLSHGVEACRGTLTQLGILLPIPPSLASALADADAGRSGYVTRDLAKIAGEAKATIGSP